MSTSTIAPQIARFARAVRDALSDLPDEERDELTEGLEADLTEAYAEDLANTLPDPVEYATELRTAAGLPMPAHESTSWTRGIADAWASTRRDLASAIRRNPAAVHLIDFLDAVRPVWWIVRAWVASWGLAAVFGGEGGFLPSSGLYWVVLLLFVVVSTQWGRGRWGFRGLPVLITVGNVIAAVLVLPVVSIANDWQRNVEYAYYDDGPGDLTGVYLDGQQVTNIFPYGHDGKLLDDVQLFDQDGNPLSTAVQGADGCIDPECETEGLWIPGVNVDGITNFNVFPMRMAPGVFSQQQQRLVRDPEQKPQDRTPPFDGVPPLIGKVSANND